MWIKSLIRAMGVFCDKSDDDALWQSSGHVYCQ